MEITNNEAIALLERAADRADAMLEMAEICATEARAIVRLLKGYEPRVITREELKEFEGSPCWFESHHTYMGKEGFWIIPAMFRTFFAGTIMSYTAVLDGVGDYGELGLSAYNKAWRCWTSRPTDEQREGMKWDA